MMNKKLAIISGGTKGLGKELCVLLGTKGYRIIALYSSDENAASTLRQELDRKKISAAVIRCDVSRPFQLEEVFHAQLAWLEECEITLIHNASASFSPQSFLNTPWSDFQALWQTNVYGFYQITQKFLPKMLAKRRGAVISVLSEAVKGEAPKGFSAYTTAKSALQAFTRTLASEYSRLGIKIYSFSPGFMDTSLTQAWDPMIRQLIMKQESAVKSPRETAELMLNTIFLDATPGTGEDYAV